MLYFAIILMLQQAVATAPSPAVAHDPAPVVVTGAASELFLVKNVYILPMSSSLDQYLANQLTRSGVLQVVLDPAKADAILTDRIGSSLETKLDELYPDPAKLAAAAAPPAKKDDDSEEEHQMQIKSNPVERTAGRGRAKGTIFLVHRGSRNVIWSAYELPRSTRPGDLDDVATTLVNKLGSAIDKEAKSAGALTGPAARKRGWRP